MKKAFCTSILALMLLVRAFGQETAVMTRETLQDKIKGGWAGQVIGVTYGGPTEFRFEGTMVNDYQPIPWYPGYVRETMTENPGLYDDLYMDLTFVEVLERKGLDATAADHADAYAHAAYPLWHANQAGRYNILNGIAPPASGHWMNNPHADDIDFQIEADFAGLMSPGMPNTAVGIGDPIGHIMNYGDGWYGGVFISAMYATAFVSSDMKVVVKEALKTIPAKSTFYKCIADVIQWNKQYPNDWKRTWFELQRKWSDETGCPDGVFRPFNIDAKMNAAYVVLGLLYGDGDYTKTLDITTHAGQDSDCNPSSAGGILGTAIGYKKIPEYWKAGLNGAEDMEFKYTSLSLNKVYELGMKHALQIIERQGGKISGDEITIQLQQPVAVRFEQSFPQLFPSDRLPVKKLSDTDYMVSITGPGFVIRGEAHPAAGSNWDYTGDFAFTAELFIDGEKKETASFPASHARRRHDLFWNYELTPGQHTLRIQLLNPDPRFRLDVSDVLVYSGEPTKRRH